MESDPLGVLSLLPMVLIGALSLWMSVRILHKAGYSGWWSLFMLVPFLNIAALWAFAPADWPRLRRLPG